MGDIHSKISTNNLGTQHTVALMEGYCLTGLIARTAGVMEFAGRRDSPYGLLSAFIIEGDKAIVDRENAHL